MYIPLLPFSASRIFSKSCICGNIIVTKSACPTAAGECLPAAICPHSRWRSQPLSGVSREQRYNTLDFPRKVVCHETAGFFGFFRSKGNSIPSEHPRQRRPLFPFESPCQQGCCSPLLDDPESRGESSPLDTPSFSRKCYSTRSMVLQKFLKNLECAVTMRNLVSADTENFIATPPRQGQQHFKINNLVLFFYS